MIKKSYADCHVCGGKVKEQHVDKICRRGGQIIEIIQNVPAGVCEQCGERYYSVKVLKAIDALISSHKISKRRIEVPIVEYA